MPGTNPVRSAAGDGHGWADAQLFGHLGMLQGRREGRSNPLQFLAGDSRGRVSSFFVRAASGFGAGQIQISLQRVEHGAGKFVAPFVLLGVAPVTIQAGGVVQVFGESLAVSAFANERVAELTSTGSVENAPGSSAARIYKAQENFSAVEILAAVVPGEAGVNFGMETALAGALALRLNRNFF